MVIRIRQATPEELSRGVIAKADIPKQTKLIPRLLGEAISDAHKRGALSEAEAIGVSATPSRKGRPSTGKAKKAVTIRLDPDIVAALEGREDWRNEVNALLRSHLRL